jgi:hypothetical protein
MSLLTSVTDDSMPLFSASLISPDVAAQLPEGYTIRPLQKGDYQKGFLDVLRVLTTVGDVTDEVCYPSTFCLHAQSTTLPIAIPLCSSYKEAN